MSNLTNNSYVEEAFYAFTPLNSLKEIIDSYHSKLEKELDILNIYIIYKQKLEVFDCNLLRNIVIKDINIFNEIPNEKITFIENLNYLGIKNCLFININKINILLELKNYNINSNLEYIFKISEVFLVFFLNKYLYEKFSIVRENKTNILNDIYKKIIQVNDIDELISYIINFLTIRKNFDRVLFLIQDKENFKKYSGIISNIENKQKISILFDSDLNKKSDLLSLLKKNIFISNIANEKTFTVIPIISKNKIIAILGVDNYFKQKSIPKEEITILEEIVEQTAFSIENMRLYDDIKLNTISFKQLFEVSSSFNSTLDYEEASKIIVDKISSSIFVTDAYLISLEIGKYGKIISSSNNKFINTEVKLTDPLRQAIITNQIVTYNFKKTPGIKCLDFKYALISPLIIKDKITALLCLGESNQYEERNFSKYEINLVKTMSQQAAITLENTKLYNGLTDVVLDRTVELIESNKELQAQKEKLQILSNRLEAILDSIPDGIVVIDENYKILSYNKSFENVMYNVFDKEIHNLLNISIYADICKENKEIPNVKNLLKLIENIKKYIEEDNRNPIDFEVYKENYTIYYKILMAPVKFVSENKNLNTVIVFNNITKEKEIDKLKSDFIAVVSHELKTPVSAMMGYTSLIEDAILDGLDINTEDYLKKIQNQGERLIRLINDLLDFSKLEAGQMKMHFQLTDVYETVIEIIEILRPLVDEKNMNIVYNIQENLEPINVDTDKLKQILINLIGNAIKFTPENTGTIEVNVSKILDNQILFYVKDNGIGIPQDKIGKLFERFYQVDNSSTRKYGGTGLGLAIVKKIIEAHKGKIWVESKASEGSTFFFNLPINDL